MTATNGGTGTLASALEAALQQTFEAKAELDAIDDSISKQITMVEDALKALRLGVRLSTEKNLAEYEVLAFDKLGGQWRLVLETYDPMSEEVEQQPVKDLDRKARAEVVEEALPFLLIEASAQMREMVKERQGAIATGNTVVEALTKALGKAVR